jgi:hypothetical protein
MYVQKKQSLEVHVAGIGNVTINNTTVWQLANEGNRACKVTMMEALTENNEIHRLHHQSSTLYENKSPIASGHRGTASALSPAHSWPSVISCCCLERQLRLPQATCNVLLVSLTLDVLLATLLCVQALIHECWQIQAKAIKAACSDAAGAPHLSTLPIHYQVPI